MINTLFKLFKKNKQVKNQEKVINNNEIKKEVLKEQLPYKVFIVKFNKDYFYTDDEKIANKLNKVSKAITDKRQIQDIIINLPKI